MGSFKNFVGPKDLDAKLFIGRLYVSIIFIGILVSVFLDIVVTK